MREDAITRAVARVEDMVKGVPDECQMLCEEPEGTTAWSLTVADLRTVLAALREARADAARLNWLLRDTMFDEIGGVDINDEACRLWRESDLTLDEPTREMYAQAYRNAIDAARAAGGTNG